jgi:hypothetical protein
VDIYSYNAINKIKYIKKYEKLTKINKNKKNYKKKKELGLPSKQRFILDCSTQSLFHHPFDVLER